MPWGIKLHVVDLNFINWSCTSCEHWPMRTGPSLDHSKSSDHQNVIGHVKLDSTKTMCCQTTWCVLFTIMSWSMIEVYELIWFTRLADDMQAMSTTNRCTFNWWQYSTQAGCSKRFSTILDALSLSHLRPLIGSCSPSRPLIGPLWWRQVGVPGSQSRVIEPRHDKNSSRNQ